MDRRTCRRLGFVFTLLVGSAPLVSRATTIPVTTTADDLTVNGNCTLREAIRAANGDVAVDACPAGSGADVITVPAGTYVLTRVGVGENAAATGDLDVTANVSLVGAGAASTIIDGNATDRVFDIDPAAAGVAVSLAGVTIRNGGGVPEGGGIRNAGTLTITDSVIRENAASAVDQEADGGGVLSTGPVTITTSAVLRNTARAHAVSGTAVAAVGGVAAPALTVVDSTIDANSASGDSGAYVGGISASVLVLTRSTVSNNAAFAGSFPQPTLSAEGGIGADQATITNSTVTGNTAAIGDGVVTGSGTLEFSNSTIPDGIMTFFDGATFVFRNTIVQGCAVFSSSSPGGAFTTVADDYNLDQSDTCGMSGTDLRGVDPKLGPLADNGGPTETRVLLAGSPAIDAANPATPGSGGGACEATDQRGVARPDGPRCDIGAVEGGPLPTTTTTATTTTTTTTILPFCNDTTPRGGCQPARAHGSVLHLRDRPDDAKDRLSWKWSSSGSVPDVGSPTTTTSYSVCVYQAARLIYAGVLADGTCGGRPCWRASGGSTPTRYLYRDPAAEPAFGISRLKLELGASAGKGRIAAKGRGSHLGMPPLPLASPGTSPVRVQLVPSSDVSTCWEARFTSSTRNDVGRFDATSE